MAMGTALGPPTRNPLARLLAQALANRARATGTFIAPARRRDVYRRKAEVLEPVRQGACEQVSPRVGSQRRKDER
jgi:hypothetical protein